MLTPEIARLRAEIGDLARNEEDVLTFAMFPDLGKTWLQQRRDGTLKPEALLPAHAADKSTVSAATPTEFVIDVHGESYRVAITGVGAKGANKRHVYLTLDGMPLERACARRANASRSARWHATTRRCTSTRCPAA